MTWRSREKLGDQGQELGAHSELLITHTTCFFGSSTHTACFFGSSTHTACIFIGEHAVFGSGQTYYTMPGLVAVHSLTCTNQTSRKCPFPCYPSFPRMTYGGNQSVVLHDLSFLENTHCLHSRQPSPFLAFDCLVPNRRVLIQLEYLQPSMSDTEKVLLGAAEEQVEQGGLVLHAPGHS